MEHLHNFKIIEEGSWGIVEICTECGHKEVTKKYGKDEQIDNDAYRKSHERDFLQPSDPRFKEIYPDSISNLEKHEQKKENLKRISKEINEKQEWEINQDTKKSIVL